MGHQLFFLEGKYPSYHPFNFSVKGQWLPASANVDAHALERDPAHSAVGCATASFPAEVLVYYIYMYIINI